LDIGRGYDPHEYKRVLRKVRKLKRILESYARFLLDTLGVIEGSPDMIEGVRGKLEELVASGKLEHKDVDRAKAILEFLRSAPGWQVELFRRALNKEVSMRRGSSVTSSSGARRVERSRDVREWRRVLKEVRKLRDRLRGYADYVLDLLHSSLRSKATITTFDGCIGTNLGVPSSFFTVAPSTNILALLKSTLTTAPSCPLKSPLTILTLSPFLTGRLLTPYLSLSSPLKGALTSFCLACSGAFSKATLCFLGCLLPVNLTMTTTLDYHGG
jgi:hypothetical protein